MPSWTGGFTVWVPPAAAPRPLLSCVSGSRAHAPVVSVSSGPPAAVPFSRQSRRRKRYVSLGVHTKARFCKTFSFGGLLRGPVSP